MLRWFSGAASAHRVPLQIDTQLHMDFGFMALFKYTRGGRRTRRPSRAISSGVRVFQSECNEYHAANGLTDSVLGTLAKHILIGVRELLRGCIDRDAVPGAADVSDPDTGGRRHHRRSHRWMCAG